MQAAAQQYVEILERTLRRYPYHWYHFKLLWEN